jgi:hypothetical protein
MTDREYVAGILDGCRRLYPGLCIGKPERAAASNQVFTPVSCECRKRWLFVVDGSDIERDEVRSRFEQFAQIERLLGCPHAVRS